MTTAIESTTERDARCTPSSGPERAPASVLAWPVGLFVVVTIPLLFLIGDLRFDLAHGVPAVHVWTELGALAFAIAGAAGTMVQLLSAIRRGRALQRDLQSMRSDAARFRAESEAMRRRLGMAVERSFTGWGLTGAEKEIAFLVLRGLSYKEVAAARGTAERTVRHQTMAIYRKAGVAGRAEMAALFLRDVLDASQGTPEAPPQGATQSPSLVC